MTSARILDFLATHPAAPVILMSSVTAGMFVATGWWLAFLVALGTAKWAAREIELRWGRT